MPARKQLAQLRCQPKKQRKAQLAAARAARLSKPSTAASGQNSTMTPLADTVSPSVTTHDGDEQLRLSAAKRKLDYFSASNTLSTSNAEDLPTTICDLNTLRNLFTGVKCCKCSGSDFSLHHNSSENMGFAVKLKLTCNICESVCSESYTSKKIDRVMEINRRATAASLCAGFGQSGLSNFCEFMCMPGLHEKSFRNHMDFVVSNSETFSKVILEESRRKVREVHAQENGEGAASDGVLDLCVSYDGSWHTRGHKSKTGVGCVVEAVTGLCIDFHVMSNYCQLCFITGERLHSANCQKNFDGTSGAMEIEGARVLWSRSLDFKFRYVSVISDGDCKTYNCLRELKPYGENCTVTKEECVNHVSKRLGTALRNVVDTAKKIGKTLGGKKEGSLTQNKITKLQKYYTRAVRGTSTVENMQNAIWATYYHCISSNENQQHQLCPPGEDSWCFVKRAEALNVPVPHHQEKNKTYLNALVAEYIKPVYIKVTDASLLSRCLQGKTQNSNECLHSVIWAKCPKHMFASLKRVSLAVSLGVGEFNQGSAATHKFFKYLNLPVGDSAVKKGCRCNRATDRQGIASVGR